MTLAEVKVWQAFRFPHDPKVRIRRSRLQYSEEREPHPRIWFHEAALRCEVVLVDPEGQLRRPNR